jgi:hypothetical protein
MFRRSIPFPKCVDGLQLHLQGGVHQSAQRCVANTAFFKDHITKCYYIVLLFTAFSRSFYLSERLKKFNTHTIITKVHVRKIQHKGEGLWSFFILFLALF